jgi:hypothetical protein
MRFADYGGQKAKITAAGRARRAPKLERSTLPQTYPWSPAGSAGSVPYLRKNKLSVLTPPVSHVRVLLQKSQKPTILAAFALTLPSA